MEKVTERSSPESLQTYLPNAIPNKLGIGIVCSRDATAVSGDEQEALFNGPSGRLHKKNMEDYAKPIDENEIP